jgi:hypothetical protein
MSTFPAAKEAADADADVDVDAVAAETRERCDDRSCFMSREKVAEAAKAATDWRPSRFSRVQFLSAIDVRLYNAFVAQQIHTRAK